MTWGIVTVAIADRQSGVKIFRQSFKLTKYLLCKSRLQKHAGTVNEILMFHNQANIVFSGTKIQ